MNGKKSKKLRKISKSIGVGQPELVVKKYIIDLKQLKINESKKTPYNIPKITV